MFNMIFHVFQATSLPTPVSEGDLSPSPGREGWSADGHDSNDDYGDEVSTGKVGRDGGQ